MSKNACSVPSVGTGRGAPRSRAPPSARRRAAREAIAAPSPSAPARARNSRRESSAASSFRTARPRAPVPRSRHAAERTGATTGDAPASVSPGVVGDGVERALLALIACALAARAGARRRRRLRSSPRTTATSRFAARSRTSAPGTDFPDPGADPFCVEFDKTNQNVTDFGIVDFLSKEPARVAAAVAEVLLLPARPLDRLGRPGPAARALALGRRLLLRQGARRGRRQRPQLPRRRRAEGRNPVRAGRLPALLRPQRRRRREVVLRDATRTRPAPRRSTRRPSATRSTAIAACTRSASRPGASSTGGTSAPCGSG